MANSFVALDVGSRSAHAVWLTMRGTRPVISKAKSFSLPMDEENPNKLISQWVDSIGLNHHFCAIALPGEQSNFQSGRIMPNDPRSVEEVANMDILQFSEMAGDQMDHSVFGFEPKNEPKVRRYILSMARPQAVQDSAREAEARHIRPSDLIAAPVALFNAAESMAGQHDKPWCYICIGDKETHIAIGVPEGLLFARSIPVGGKMFTDAIVSATGLPPVQAEVQKHAGGLGDFEKHTEELHQATDRWVAQLNAALGVYRNSFADRKFAIDAFYLTGGGALLKGLPAYLTTKLAVPVRLVTELPNVPSALKKEPCVFDIAYGLALTASRACISYLSLLPDSLKDEVAFRQKKPWWILSALLLLASLGIYSATGLYLLQSNSELLENEKKKLAAQEDINKSIQAMRKQSLQIVTNEVPLQDLLVNGPLARAVLSLVCASVDPNDWITLFCDKEFYSATEQLSEENAAQPVQAPAASPFSLFRTLRPAPVATPQQPQEVDTQQKRETLATITNVFIVEGYTPNPNLTSVKEMIKRLRTAPEIMKVDVLRDDKVLTPTGIPELNDANLPKFKRFVLEIEVKRP